jgi:tetratricopeptide (TPR) repeat protein
MHPLRSVSLKVFISCFLLLACTGCTKAIRRERARIRAEHYFKAGDYDKAKIEYIKLLQLDQMNQTAIKQLGTIWLDEGAPLRALVFLKTACDQDPKNADIRAKFASALLAVGEATEARKQALTALRQSPGNTEALFALVDSSRTEKDLKDTEALLQQLKVPESSALHLVRGNFAMRNKDAATARKEFQRALEMAPKSPVAHTMMANFYLFQNEPKRAGEEFKAAAELAPVRSIQRFRYAQFQVQNGALKDARETLKEITQKAPDYLPAWILSAQLALKEKNYDQSLSLLENVTSRDPENIDAGLLRAQALLGKGDGKKAVTVLENLDKTYPNVPGIRFYLARAELLNKDVTHAIADLNRAVAVKPDYVEAILLLAQLNLQTGNPQPVIAAMTDLLKKRPGLAPAQSILAEAYRSTGRLDEAAAVMREQIKAMPKNPQAQFLLGLILRQQNKTAEAREAFQKTLQLAPNNLLPVDQLVDLDIAGSDFKSAMERVQAELKKTPDSAPLHLIEGKIYMAQHAWDQAESVLQKALKLNPNYTSAYDLLITTYIAAKKLPQAQAQLNAFLSKQPDNAAALMTLGEIYEKQKDWARARRTYEKILEKNPEFVPAMNNLAYLYATRFNEIDKANELAQKAHSLRQDPAITDTLGWVLYKKGDYQQALALLQQSAAKLVQNPIVQFHLGMASYMMDRPEPARAAFQLALKEGKDFEGKEEAQRRLALLDDASSWKLSVQQLESTLKQHPNDLFARLQLAGLYEKQKAFAQAAAQYESVLKINPKLLSPSIQLAQLNAGPLHNSEKALDFAKKARAIAPTNAKIAGMLGEIAYRAGNFTWAYSLLQESARQLTGDPDVLHNCAWAAYSLGKVSEARDLMQRAMQAGPASSITEDAKSFLSMTVDQNPKQAAALEPQVESVLKGDPNYPPALMVRAGVEEQRGDVKKAIADYNQVLGRFPDFAPAQKRLAALYAKDPGALDKAYELAMKARRALPGDPEIARTLGEISYRKQDYAAAIRLLQESARTAPLPADDLYYLGVAQLQTGQEQKGRKTLQQALAAGLKGPFAQEARHRLAEKQNQPK